MPSLPTTRQTTRPIDPPPTHPRAVIAAHWVSAFALLLVVALVLASEGIDDKPTRALLLQAHRATGLFVWLLALTRVGLRSRLPLAATRMPAWQWLAARTLQALMYALLIALPVLGYLLTNARGAPVTLPLLGALPTVLARDLDLADTLEAAHASAAWALLGLVALHAAVAVWHHRVRRDGVLSAMWPALRRRR